MKKQKKTQTVKNIRQNQEYRINVYLQGLKDFCSQIDIDEVYDSLTEKDKALLYFFRGVLDVHIQGDLIDKEMIGKEIKDSFYMVVKNFMEDRTFDVIPGKLTISCFDYYYYFQVLLIILYQLKSKLPEKQSINDLLNIDQDDFDVWHRFCHSLDVGLFSLAISLSDFRTGITQILFNPNNSKTIGGRMNIDVTFILHKPIKKRIRLNDKITHTGIQVQLIYALEAEKLMNVEFSLSQLGIKKHFADLKLPLFVSEHALMRLDERNNLFPEMTTQKIFVESLMEPTFTRNSAGRILMEGKLGKDKVGYFLLDVVDGVIFIRTFLFLTNNSTPEGENLNKLTGLEKADKQYFKIDNLFDFVKSDIMKNEETCALFEKAGCESLIRICKKIDIASKDAHFKIKQTSLASKLLAYIHPEG